MPLFEVETNAHIMIAWAENKEEATEITKGFYPDEDIVRLTKRPRPKTLVAGAVGLSLLALGAPLGPKGMPSTPCAWRGLIPPPRFSWRRCCLVPPPSRSLSTSKTAS